MTTIAAEPPIDAKELMTVLSAGSKQNRRWMRKGAGSPHPSGLKGLS